MSIDLCYVISHGFAARMLLQTGLIRQLAERGQSVAIITPDPDDENLAEFQRQNNVTIFGSNEKNNIWNEDYLFKRKYYLEDIKANPALWEKHVYALYYSRSKHPWRRVRPLFYYFIHTLIKRFPSIRRNFIRDESKYLQSDKTRDLIKQINPKLVISTYPVNFLEAKVLFAARQRRIPTLIHLLSWDNITSKGKFPAIADYFIAWGAVMRRELKAHYGIAEKRIFICGVPHFDYHIQVKEQSAYRSVLKDMGLQPDQPYLLFAMSAPRFAPREIEIVEDLAGCIEQNVFGPNLQLIVRPHPQNVQGSMADRSWLKRLKMLDSRRVKINFPRLNDSRLQWSMQKEDMHQLSNLLAGCSICINSGSTVSIDALMMEKPVILTSFDGSAKLPYWKSARRLVDYTHLKKFVQFGGARVVSSSEAFRQAIKDYLKNPDRDLDRRQEALIQECFSKDGQSTKRVLQALDDILYSISENVS